MSNDEYTHFARLLLGLVVALEYAIDEADGWHDEARGGPCSGENIDGCRGLLQEAKVLVPDLQKLAA